MVTDSRPIKPIKPIKSILSTSTDGFSSTTKKKKFHVGSQMRTISGESKKTYQKTKWFGRFENKMIKNLTVKWK